MISILRAWFSSHLALLGIGLLLLSSLQMIASTSGMLAEAEQFEREVEATVSRVLADELASGMLAERASESKSLVAWDRSGYRLSSKFGSNGRGPTLKIEVTSPSRRQFRYRARILEGAAPYPLGRPLSISRAALSGAADRWEWIWEMPIPEPSWIPEHHFPLLVDEKADVAELGAEFIGLKHDASIALLHLAGGTDQRDFVLHSNDGETLRPPLSQPAWVRVGGNLWLVDQSGSIELRLDNSLTVLVHGNIYIGSDIRVSGPGKLTLVNLQTVGNRYRDLDMDGRFTSGDESREYGGGEYGGWIEGSGAVYVGLPGRRGEERNLVFEGSLVAEGEVYLRAPAWRLHGALVLGSCLIFADESSRLSLPADRLPDPYREAIPGFAISGPPRPGMLDLRKR
ncbi:MAG: hypothetical protein ACYTG5_00500 [Planctomycetota bacterium]